MHYLIDGYNLLFRLPKTKHSLQHKRDLFIRELNDLADQFSLNITVIFDAGFPQGLSRSHYDTIEIVYTTQGLSADSYIIQFLEEQKKPSDFCVVSSDLELIHKSELRGAHKKTIKDFFSFLQNKKTKKTKQHPVWKPSVREIERLREIFEKRLKDTES